MRPRNWVRRGTALALVFFALAACSNRPPSYTKQNCDALASAISAQDASDAKFAISALADDQQWHDPVDPGVFGAAFVAARWPLPTSWDMWETRSPWSMLLQDCGGAQD